MKNITLFTHYFILTILLINQLSVVTNISFIMVGDEDKCFNKEFDDNERIKFSFLISGEDELNTRVVILDPASKEIHGFSAKEEGTWYWMTTEAGNYQFCFFPDSRAYNTISFELQNCLGCCTRQKINVDISAARE